MDCLRDGFDEVLAVGGGSRQTLLPVERLKESSSTCLSIKLPRACSGALCQSACIFVSNRARRRLRFDRLTTSDPRLCIRVRPRAAVSAERASRPGKPGPSASGGAASSSTSSFASEIAHTSSRRRLRPTPACSIDSLPSGDQAITVPAATAVTDRSRRLLCESPSHAAGSRARLTAAVRHRTPTPPPSSRPSAAPSVFHRIPSSSRLHHPLKDAQSE